MGSRSDNVAARMVTSILVYKLGDRKRYRRLTGELDERYDDDGMWKSLFDSRGP